MTPPQPRAPDVSVIIPARNEARNIERVVRSVAEQPEVLEIIVVDDQSADRTPQILDELRREISSLKIIRLDALPPGWVGKNYAVATGAAKASGDWLLFTDADTDHLPGSLREALGRAREQNADLFSFSPGQETPTWWEKAVIPRAFIELARLYPFDKVADPTSDFAAANGQYMLIRRTVYDRIGGYTAVREDILEDVAIAKRVKQLGGRIVFLPGSAWVRTRMYQTFDEMWDGWTKNLYLLYGRRIGKILAACARLWRLDLALLFFAAVLALLSILPEIPLLWIAGGLGSLYFILEGRRIILDCRAMLRLGFPRGALIYSVIGAPLFGFLLLNSLRAHRFSGNVRWKDRSYPTHGGMTQ